VDKTALALKLVDEGKHYFPRLQSFWRTKSV
jgi:hypothetical protein